MNYYFNKHIRWMFNYTDADLDEFADGDGDFEDGDNSFSVFQTRLQFNF